MTPAKLSDLLDMNQSVPARSAGAAQGVTIAITGFLPVMAIVSLAPAIPTLMKHFVGEPYAATLVPLMVTAPGALVALLSPLAGWMADRIGRRVLIIAATFFYGFLGAAPLLLHSLQVIFMTRLALGLVEAVILTVVNTLLADYFDPAGRRKWLTVQGISGPILGTTIIATSGALTARFWNGAFMIYLIAFPIFIAMLMYFYEPRLGSKQEGPTLAESGAAFPVKTVVVYSAVTLFTAVLYYVFLIQGGLAFEAIGVTSAGQLGILIGAASIGVPAGAFAFGLLSKRWSIAQLMALTLATFGVGLMGISFMRDFRWMTAFAFIQQFGSGAAVPTLIFWVSNVVDPQHRGRAMGAWVSAFFAGQFLSPAIFALVRNASGSLLRAFTVMGALGLIGAVAAILLSGVVTPLLPDKRTAPIH